MSAQQVLSMLIPAEDHQENLCSGAAINLSCWRCLSSCKGFAWEDLPYLSTAPHKSIFYGPVILSLGLAKPFTDASLTANKFPCLTL